MEKKLNINFILKGIAVFAFVAFCLLAILAGVTLPFVSNASTVDTAFASAESDSATASANNDIDYESFTIPISQCNGTDTYYGFYITETFYNYISNFAFSGDYESGLLCFQVNPSRIYAMNQFTNSENNVVKFFGYTYGMDTHAHYILTNDLTYSESDKAFIDTNGFTFLADDTGNIFSGFFVSVPQEFRSALRVFNRLPVKETIVTEYITNIGFQSRFGFVGTMPSSNLFLNLQEKPILPDSLRTIKDSNGNLVNGWTYHDNSYWLPLINAYDGFGNPVDGGFTGWNVFNLQYNSNGELISQPELNFWFDNLTFTNSVNVNFVNGVLSVPDFTNISYRYESNFSNSDNLLVYASLNKSYKYYLQPNISQNDVSKFFALIDYRNYKPLDNDFYVAGYNSASKGYYDTGYNKGYSVGKDDGYRTGFSAGDSQGFARGVDSANTYSFLGLFGAIFDAPIKAIFGGTSTLPAGTTITDSNGKTITLTSTTTVNRAGLLNFNLMGVNLSGFVLALFSISIIVVVIKFALAKK